MFKKILYTCLCFTISMVAVFAQPVNVTNISATGHFDPVNPQGGGCGVLPTITATYLSGTGTTVVNGAIVCSDQCGSTTVRVDMSNVRWSKTATINWLHGISFTPGNVTVNVPPGGLPAGWDRFSSSTGSSCSSGITTGIGFYFDGTNGNSCCPGNNSGDNNPSNNYGDVVADCGFPYAFFFDLTFCNSSITANPLLFSVRGTSDYQTGCWSVLDPIGTSKIQFVLASSACTQPIFTTLPTATAPVKSCAGGTVNYTCTLTSACGSGAGVTWWTAATGGTQVGTGSPFVYDPPGSACPSGTTLYAACCPIGNTCATRRAVTIGGVCSPALDITNVDITNPTCTTPTGSINSVTVTGNAGPVLYTLNPGNITNNTGIFLGLTGLSYTLTAMDDAGCSKTVPVTFTPGGTGGTPPTVVSPVTYCQNQTLGVVPLVANTTSPSGVLTWYLPGSTTGIPNAPTPATAVAGTFTYNVTQTIGACVSAQVPIVVTINPTPAAPTATTPIPYCQGATATVLTAVGTNLKWYTVSTGGTALPGAPTPSTSTPGTTTYYVSQTTGTCEGARFAINVVVTATPVAPLVSNLVNYCQAATASALTATGSGLLWYTAATGGTGSATAPTPTTGTVGTTLYYVSQTILGCESPRALINVVVAATPAAPTVTTPVTYCQGATATQLTATGVGLLWYTTATVGTGSSTAPTPSTSAGGSTVYYVSATAGTCEGLRAAITVTITSTPAAPTAASPVVYCQGATSTQLTATGNNLLWYTTITGGTGSTTAPTPTTTAAGNTTYYVTQSTTGVVCESPRTAILVTVNPKPATPTVTTPVKYCQNANATALIASGTNLLWYTTANGGVGSGTAIVPSTASVGNTTYYVSQATLNCESDRAPIVVNVSAALTVNAGNAVTIARGDQTQLNGTATAGANYLWTSNITPLSLSSATILNPIAKPLETTIYKLTVSDPANLCPSVNSSVIVTVVQSCINVRNAFTPNGDGVNDYWLVYDQNFCLQAGGAAVTVFNRYGSKVFESKNYTNNWDGTYKGKAVPDGTYYAVLEFVLFNGTKQFVKTDITILR